MSYRFVMENGELHAVPVEPAANVSIKRKLYAVGTRILFPRAIESSAAIAVAVA